MACCKYGVWGCEIPSHYFRADRPAGLNRAQQLAEYRSRVPMDHRVYLNVPFAEKNEVKALKAMWDPDKKAWYAASDLDMSQFARWMPAPAPAVTETPNPIVAETEKYGFDQMATWDELMGALRPATEEIVQLETIQLRVGRA